MNISNPNSLQCQTKYSLAYARCFEIQMRGVTMRFGAKGAVNYNTGSRSLSTDVLELYVLRSNTSRYT